MKAPEKSLRAPDAGGACPSEMGLHGIQLAKTVHGRYSKTFIGRTSGIPEVDQRGTLTAPVCCCQLPH